MSDSSCQKMKLPKMKGHFIQGATKPRSLWGRIMNIFRPRERYFSFVLMYEPYDTFYDTRNLTNVFTVDCDESVLESLYDTSHTTIKEE